MNKYGFIGNIENKLEETGITHKGALSIDMPVDNKTDEIFVYNMSYTTFKRDLIAIYNTKTDTVRKPNF